MRSDRQSHLHDSIVVSIPACHAGDRGSIPRRGVFFRIKSACVRYLDCIETSVSGLLLKLQYFLLN